MASLSSAAAKAKAEKERKRMVGGTKTSATKTGSSSAIGSLMDKYSQSSAGSTADRYGGGTNVLPTASPAYTAPKAKAVSPTFSAPSTGVAQASLTGATSSATGGAGGSATGTTGGVTSASTGSGDDMLAPLTGQVGEYGIRGNAIPMLYQEPQALLRMAMASMGQSANKNPGMYNMALPNADLVNALSMIGLGNDYKAGDHSSMLNYMDNLFRQGITRGGDTVDFQSGMSNILGADINTPMGEMLRNDDPTGQYNALASLMLPLAEAGMHPLFARSLQKSMERLRDEYYSRYANGTPPQNADGSEESMASIMNRRLGLGG